MQLVLLDQLIALAVVLMTTNASTRHQFVQKDHFVSIAQVALPVNVLAVWLVIHSMADVPNLIYVKWPFVMRLDHAVKTKIVLPIVTLARMFVCADKVLPAIPPPVNVWMWTNVV